MLAAQTYQVPPAVMTALCMAEGGRVGQEVGPNSQRHLRPWPHAGQLTLDPELAQVWHVDHRQPEGPFAMTAA